MSTSLYLPTYRSISRPRTFVADVGNVGSRETGRQLSNLLGDLVDGRVRLDLFQVHLEDLDAPGQVRQIDVNLPICEKDKKRRS